MAYYRIYGVIYEDLEEHIQAKSKKQALLDFEKIHGKYVDDIYIEKMDKAEYDGLL